MLSPTPSPAPTPRGEFIARTHPAKNGVMPYRLFIPKAYDPRQRYPLIVWLHGAGGIGTDNAAQIAGDQIPGTHTWTTPERQAEHPAFIVVPQSPGVWTSTGSPDLGPHLEAVDGILDGLAAEFPVDPDRIYLLGQSNGGYGAWNLLSNRSNRFAAAVLLCPIKGDITRAVHAATLPMWVFWGDHDSAAIVEGSRAMVAALRAAGGQPRVTEYRGAGHDIWTRVFNEPEIVPWLFAQRR